MRLTVKLYAGLSPFLPPSARDNTLELESAEPLTPATIIARFNLPLELVHIVLVNGIYVKPEDRAGMQLQDGDTLAMWPPVAGG